MDAQTMLEALKVDLGISTTAYDTRLTEYLNMAAAAIAGEGITLDLTEASDGNLQVMYAAWLWRRRSGDDKTTTLTTQKNVTGMPRMLRYLLNNRLFAEKAKGAE